MSSRVFLVQRPSYYDKKAKGWVNKYDFSAAREFGDFVILLRPGNIFGERFEQSVVALKEGLKDYDPDKDHILATGDPVGIAAAVMIAGQKGAVSLLRYDRRANQYMAHSIRIESDDTAQASPGKNDNR